MKAKDITNITFWIICGNEFKAVSLSFRALNHESNMCRVRNKEFVPNAVDVVLGFESEESGMKFLRQKSRKRT